jgi:predicted DNA-binding ribbon-helix-helix protein
MTDLAFNAPWPRDAVYSDRATYTGLALELVERNSRLKSRNIIVEGRRTSVRLEPAMWEALKDIAAWEKKSINEIVSGVARCRMRSGSLTSAIRIFVMAYFRARSQALHAA